MSTNNLFIIFILVLLFVLFRGTLKDSEQFAVAYYNNEEYEPKTKKIISDACNGMFKGAISGGITGGFPGLVSGCLTAGIVTMTHGARHLI